MGCATAHFFGPAPWGPGEGPKGQISLKIIKFQLQSQFQRFLNQTSCVFSHMKDIKHIRRDLHLDAWVPRGGGGGGGYSKFFLIRRLGPSIYRSPPKNIRNFKHPKKIFEILATQKNIPILYLDLKKRP